LILFDFTRPRALVFLLLLIPIVYWYKNSISDMPVLRRKAVFVIRVIIVVLIVFALSEFRIKLPRNELSVLFVVDSSLSIPPDNLEWARDYIKKQVKKLPKGDKVGVVIFGKSAMLEESLSRDPDISQFSSIISPQYTDISRAIQLATAVFPESTVKRVVLISDGNENLGNSEHQASLASARGVQIDCLPYPPRDFPEVLVSSFESQGNVTKGEPFALKLEVYSTRKVRGIVRVSRNNREIAREKVDIAPGKNMFTIAQNIDQPGNYQYKASLEVEEDRFPHNNTSETLTVVQGHPRVLYLYSDPRQKKLIPPFLVDQKFKLEVKDPSGLPANLQEMSGYQSVIFDNVSGLGLSPRQMKMMENYVKDLGGGFIMIGGENSFGAGGYYKSPVERILPVDLDIKKSKNLPSLAMVLCIDKSGSMGSMTGGVEKMKLAREAGIATTELLSPADSLGVIGFDYAAKWVSPLQYVRNRQRIVNEIASIRAGGGTSMYPALNSAYIALKGTRAMLKHVIVLTDGRSAPGDFEGIAKEMLKDNITISTVGVGKDADIEFLRDLAKWGQGRFYYTDEAGLLPRIFVRESILAGRSALVEEKFIPKKAGPGEFLKGINMEKMPPLLGYVMTIPKNRAQLILGTHQDDPLLAYWRIGLGKSVAFTSDDGLRWAKNWVSWKEFPAFWTQMVRWTLPVIRSERFRVDMKIEGGRGKIIVEAIDETGKLLNFLPLYARVISPSGETDMVSLSQSASGRYEGNIFAEEVGTYFVNVVEEIEGQPRTGRIHAFTIPYSPEYRSFKTNTYLLRRIASITGGNLISPGDNIFRKGSRVVHFPKPAWMELLLIALLLFPLDIALRRVYLPEDFYEKVGQMFGGKKRMKPAYSGGSVSALKAKKEELRESLTEGGDMGARKEKGREEEKAILRKSPIREKKKVKDRRKVGGDRKKPGFEIPPVSKTAAPSSSVIDKKEEPEIEEEADSGTLGRLKKVKKQVRDGKKY